MTMFQQNIEQILAAANALVRDLIADTDRIVNTPTTEWIVYARQHELKMLRDKAAVASDTFRQWIENGVPIKKIGKIRGGLASIRMSAHHSSTTDSRTNGRASLRSDLQYLIEAFGKGCELENQVSTPTQFMLDPERDQQTRQTAVKMPRVDPEERPYKLRELAILHGVDYMTALRWYENEPGVLINPSTADQQRKSGRRYRTIRVPRHVYRRVRSRMENRET